MIPLDYDRTGAATPKVVRPPTYEVPEKQAWLGMIWYLIFFAGVGLFLAVLRMRNL